MIYLVHYVIQGNPSPKEHILQPPVIKMLPGLVSPPKLFPPCKEFPLISIQCEKVQRPEKQVLKKLKLVHIQVEKTKAGTSSSNVAP